MEKNSKERFVTVNDLQNEWKNDDVNGEEKNWGKEREARLGLSVTPVICWQSRNRMGRVPLSSQHHNDDSLCSEPQNDCK